MKINNIDRCKAYKITPEFIGVMTFINSNTAKTKYIHQVLETSLDLYRDELDHLHYIEFVKAGKTDAEKVRLSEKGKAFLKSLSEPPITNLALNVWEYLDRWYTKYDLKDKIVNKTKTVHYINEFLCYKESEGKHYDEKMMEAVIKTYLGSFKDDELKYAKKTLNLFFDTKNAYASKWNREDCPIYDFIDKNGKEIAKIYGKL